MSILDPKKNIREQHPRVCQSMISSQCKRPRTSPATKRAARKVINQTTGQRACGHPFRVCFHRRM
jgi:hypothetical protein